MSSNQLSVLSFLEAQLNGTLKPGDTTHMNYPTPISQLLGFHLVAINEGTTTLEMYADASIHGNQQGTVHGGLITELADATVGTAHSPLMGSGESFTSIDIKASFLRPVWKSRLTSHAYVIHQGKAISHYCCEIKRDDGKSVAIVQSTVMTLKGDKASGR